MTEFSENPRDFLLSESYGQHYLGNLFAELYALFRNRNISPQAGQNGTVTDTNLKALQMVINDIHSLRMDSHEKLSEIEEVLLYMHLITEATLHGLPPNNERLSLLVKELIRRHQLTTNPRNEITTVKELVSECEDIKPHSYQNLVIEKLTQLQKKVYKEIVEPDFEVHHSTNKEETSSQPKEEEDTHYLLFTYTHPFLIKIFDAVLSQYKYSPIRDEIKNDYWYWVAVNLIQKFEDLKSNKEFVPPKKFEEFIKADWEATANILRKNQIEAKLSLEKVYPSLNLIVEGDLERTRQNIEQHDKMFYDTEERLLRRIESIKIDNHAIRLMNNPNNVLFSSYNLECHALLYKMALDGSLFGEQNTVKEQPKKPIPQPVPQNKTAFFLLIVAVSHLKLVEGTDEILLNGECKIEKEKLTIKKIANWAMETFGVSYDDRETLYTTLYRYQRKNNNFLPKVRENVIGVLTYHYPEKAKEIESILDKIIPDKKNS